MTRLTAQLVVAALILAGCARTVSYPEVDQSALEDYRSSSDVELLQAFAEFKTRLKRVEYWVRVGAAPFCGRVVAPEGGLIVGIGGSWDDESVDEIAKRAFALGEAITVIYVVPDSPFASVGVMPGDEILALDGTSLEDLDSVSEYVAASAGRPVSVSLRRAEELIDVELEAPLACNFAVQFSPHDSLLPWSEDRWTIVVPAGLMRNSSDDELAIAIGHQLAHLMIGLSASKIENAESEADVLGLYMTAAAGYDVSVAPAFWEWLAAESPFIIDPAPWREWEQFHLDLAARIQRIRRTSRQLDDRMARGESIRPAGAQ